MPGEGKFRVTGNLGKVMTESAEAAVSYIRSQNERFKLEPDFYKKKDIHIHIPEGATPKDGPSAGVTMENKKDLDEIMDEIKDGMQFVLAETMEDVLQTALVKGEKDA